MYSIPLSVLYRGDGSCLFFDMNSTKPTDRAWEVQSLCAHNWFRKFYRVGWSPPACPIFCPVVRGLPQTVHLGNLRELVLLKYYCEIVPDPNPCFPWSQPVTLSLVPTHDIVPASPNLCHRPWSQPLTWPLIPTRDIVPGPNP